jgi:hypothetical protein
MEQNRPKATLWQAAKAVFWAFFGVRKGKDHDVDAVRLNPVQVIIVGIIGAALFVAFLILLVRFVTSQG